MFDWSAARVYDVCFCDNDVDVVDLRTRLRPVGEGTDFSLYYIRWLVPVDDTVLLG